MSGQPAVLQVVILQGGLLVGTEVFVPGHYVVGSGQGVDLHLSDPTVEPSHASLFFQNGRAAIQNTGSGVVFVNGHRVKACEVRAIDEIVLGPFTLKLRVLVQRPRAWATPPPEIAAIFGEPSPGPLGAQALSNWAMTAAPHPSAAAAEDAHAPEPQSLDAADRFSEGPSLAPPGTACSSEGAMSAKDVATMLASGRLMSSASAPPPIPRPPATAPPPVPAPRDSAPRAPAPRASAPRASAPRASAPRDSVPPPAESTDPASEGAMSAKDAIRMLASGRLVPGASAPPPTPRPPATVTPPLPAPRISAPRGSAPRDSAPRDSAPRDSAPRDSAPRESVPPPAESTEFASEGAMSAKEAALMLARLRSASAPAPEAADRPDAAAAPPGFAPRISARPNVMSGRVVAGK